MNMLMLNDNIGALSKLVHYETLFIMETDVWKRLCFYYSDNSRSNAYIHTHTHTMYGVSKTFIVIFDVGQLNAMVGDSVIIILFWFIL